MTDGDSDVDLDELREEYDDGGHGTQLDEKPSRDDLVDELVEALDEAEDNNMVGFRHTGVTALLDVIEATGRVEALGAELDRALDQEPRSDYNRSKLAALAVLAGIDRVETELIEDLDEASTRRKSRF